MDRTLGLMPSFLDLVKEFILEAQYQGYDVDIFSGYRSMDEQAKLYAQGRTTPGQIVTDAQPGHSWHNFGVAADVVFRDDKGNFTWNVPDNYWHELAAIANAKGLECGAYWDGPLQDLDHFQKTNGLTLEEARSLNNLQDVWNAIQSKE